MRILHIISCPASGGAEVFVKDLSLAMAAQGHSLSIVFLDRAEEAGRQIAYQKRFLAQLDSAGISYAFIGQKARRNPLYGWFRMRKVLIDHRPDVIHAHLYYGVLFQIFCRTPVVYTHHSVKLRVPAFVYRFFLNRVVSKYVAICTACARVLADAGARAIVQIDNGADVGRLVRADNLNLADESVGVTFLSIGSLADAKNYPRLLSAVAQIPKEKAWCLKIAGEGRRRAALEDLVLRLGLTDRVEFLGTVSDIGERLAAADVFVMSSEWEGLPIALIEATLSGLPVVVTNVGGCAEVVHAACNGIVVDEPGVDAFCNALCRMLDDSELRKCFSRNALKYSSRYELSTAVDKHLQLYASMVESPPMLRSGREWC